MKGSHSISGTGTITLVLIVILCMVSAAFAKDKVSKYGSAFKGWVNVGDTAPDFTIPVINSPGTFHLYDYRGYIVLINLWASW